MSDFDSKDPGDPDALPLNERSTAFIDSVAFLEFVRLKSLNTPHSPGAAKKSVTLVGSDPCDQPLPDTRISAERVAAPYTGIQVDDWDSLFDAVEGALALGVKWLTV